MQGLRKGVRLRYAWRLVEAGRLCPLQTGDSSGKGGREGAGTGRGQAW